MRPSAGRVARTEEQVRAIIADLVSECDAGRSRVEVVTAESWLERDLGIYSLERVELLLRLEEAFGTVIPEEAGIAATTVADLVALIDGRTTAPHPQRRESTEAARQAPASPNGSLVFTAYVAALLAVVGAVVWPLLHVLRGERAARLLRTGARFVLRATGCVPDVTGLRHLGGIGTAVLVANHESYVDCVILLAALPVMPKIVVNERLPGAPVIGTCVHAAGYLCVDRTSTATRITCADGLANALDAGASLLVFPEGTFPDHPGLLPFRLGAFSAAATAHRPVVPITLRGTRRMLPTGTVLLRRSGIAVTIHPPIYPAAAGWAEALRLRETARNVIAESTGVGGRSERVDTARSAHE